MRRAVTALGLVVAGGLVVGAVSCSKSYDAAPDASDASALGDVVTVDGASADGSLDGCVPSCVPGSCGADGCGGTCGCGATTACVDGTCVPCTDTWRTTGLANHMSFDAKRNYVYTSVSVDGGAAFATLNACTGAVIASRTPAPSTAGIDPVPSVNELAPFGDFVYTRGDCVAGGVQPGATCIYRYNAATNAVDARGKVATTSTSDEIWDLTVSGAGRPFASGTYAAQNRARIIPFEADGTNCGGALVEAGAHGGAIGASGDDVYQVLYTGTVDEVKLAHFKGASCMTGGACGCTPDVVSNAVVLPIADPNPTPSTYRLLVQGAIVYLVGTQFLTAGGAKGFVAAFDTVQGTWSPVYVYAPSNGAKFDGLLSATSTPDGKLLYVVGSKDAASPTGTGVLLRFDLPFPAATAPTPNGEIVVPGFQVVWDVRVSDTAVYVAGDPGVVAKCLTNLSCKN